jgi:hypothetical protein
VGMQGHRGHDRFEAEGGRRKPDVQHATLAVVRRETDSGGGFVTERHGQSLRWVP